METTTSWEETPIQLPCLSSQDTGGGSLCLARSPSDPRPPRRAKALP